jgi:hypothetical protein
MAMALSIALVFSIADGSASAAPVSRSAPHTSVVRTRAANPPTLAKTAPSGPPLTSPAGEGIVENTAGVPSAEGDQLVENGLSSPLCEGAGSADLSSTAQSDCQTSGFVGAPAPTNNYDLDVNIDTGVLGLGNGELLSVIQDLFIAPVWEALVWIVHALVVMLQWCYTLELLGGSTMSDLKSSLRETQASFTEPWLALMLAVASVLALYNGLVRRRVAETLGQVLLTIAMMAGGLWMIADPLGTVGAVGQFANQASLGTLGAVARGTTANASRTLGDSMRALFAGTIELPWCYMEFGNVRWCSDPAAMDARLRTAASNIVAAEQAKLACQPSSTHRPCPSSSGTLGLTAEHTGQLVREADTNGALFLAFPANGPERNSVKAKDSLLHVLCQAEDDTKCEGSMAAQAEFRSDSGTFPRMIGVVLIAAGVIGMTTLFGLLAVHLLASAVLSLFMLLLAPFAVLAPAIGDAGRAFFMGWLTRLLGAVSSKLIFSFLLGALLTMQRILSSLEPLGWWTQWLLISAFWWVVFLKRHQALAFVRNGGRGHPVASTRHPISRGIEGARETKRAIAHPVRWARDKLLPPLPVDEELGKRRHRHQGPGKRPVGPTGGEQEVGVEEKRIARAGQGERPIDEHPRQDRVTSQHWYTDAAESAAGVSGRAEPTDERTADAQRRTARRSTSPPADVEQVPDALVPAVRAQLARVRIARDTALAVGERRRAAMLAARGARIEAQLAGGRSPRAEATRDTPMRRSRRERDGARPQVEQPVGDPRGPGPRGVRRWTSSEIMADAREVAAGRKRQLGIEPSIEDEPGS